MADEHMEEKLATIQWEAVDKATNSEATAKAFKAVNDLTEVFDRVRQGRVTLDHDALLREHLQRLTKLMNDWYAAQK